MAEDGTFELVPAGDLVSLRQEWTRIAERSGNVFGTWEWVEAWHRHLGSGRPAVASVRRPNGDALAILPVYVARDRPVRLLRFMGAGQGDALGPICAPEDRALAARALAQHVREVLGSSGLFLGECLRGEDWLSPEVGLEALRTVGSPVLATLGRSFDEYLATRSRNFREQVRRRERRAAREHELVYRLTEDPAQLEDDMRTMMRLHATRWSEGESDTFRGPRVGFHLEFAQRALARGWLRLWTMELDGTAVAAWYGLRYGGIESYYQAGRDPEFDQLNVGFVLLCHTIRAAFEDGMQEYHFGLGAEPYKTRFTDHDPGLATIALTTGARGRAALAAVRAALRTPTGARGFVRRAGSLWPRRAQM